MIITLDAFHKLEEEYRADISLIRQNISNPGLQYVALLNRAEKLDEDRAALLAQMQPNDIDEDASPTAIVDS